MPKFEEIGNRRIYFDQMYYLCYAGGKRELKQSDQKNWNKTLCLPELAMKKEQIKLGVQNNPNVVPVKGIDLLGFIRELNFVPFFDQYFEHTHMLKLTNVLVYESIKAKSYEMAMRGK